MIFQTPIGRPRSVDELTADDVVDFITGWLPRHLDVSARQIKSHLASIRKYVHFMDTEGYLEHTAATEILQMLQQDREELIEEALAQAAAEAAPPVNLRARLKDLEARWAAIHDAQTRKKVERLGTARMKNKTTWGCDVFDRPLSLPRHMPAPSTHPQKQQETYAHHR